LQSSAFTIRQRWPHRVHVAAGKMVSQIIRTKNGKKGINGNITMPHVHSSFENLRGQSMSFEPQRPQPSRTRIGSGWLIHSRSVRRARSASLAGTQKQCSVRPPSWLA
jgi:hypothetical protein